ncbi:MAG TPA: type II secretion system protein GspC [Candidatus Binataceae bacterium]|nr:type II secretion system protein GspC [Candidatus Binataceae bacterium]
MYFRFEHPYIAALNLFLIGIIAYFLALGVSNAIKLHLAESEGSNIAVAAGGRVSRKTQAGPRPRAYYDAIVERNIFSRTPVAPAPPPVQNENLDITLIGTSHISAGKPFIIVETSDGDQSLYRLGETIPNVGRVLSISRNQAIVLHNGHRVALKIPNAGDGGTSDIPPAPPFGFRRRFMRPPRFPGRRPVPAVGPYGALSSNAGVQKLSSNKYLIGRATVDSSLSNMRSLFTQIRAVPNLQNGASNGFKLSQIQPGSIFQQIGLQDGDIVTGAQGQQVNDPMRAMIMLSALRNSPSISLNLIRDGSPMELDYTIH